VNTSTAVGWSLGQRALLRFLQREGVLAEEPSVPAGEPATNAALFARLASSIDQSGLVSLVADSLRVPSIDLDAEVLMQDLISLLTPDLAAACEMIPVAQHDDMLEVATANPLDVDALKTIEFTTGLRVRARVTTRASVLRALATWYGIAVEAPAPEPAADARPISIAVEPLGVPVAIDEPVALEVASPLVVPEAPAPEPERAELPAAAECPDGGQLAARLTGPAGVLVVSADAGVRGEARALLATGALGATIMTGRDAEEAQAVVRAGRVHVLVVDARGAADGSVWERLAADARAALVVLAGSPAPGSANGDPGPAAVPIELDALVAHVRRLLIDQRGEPT
jgi:hypothetical protein